MYANRFPYLPRMIETPQSDQIESVGYDGGSLFVSFRHDGAYQYNNVSESIFHDLVRDSSPGSYLSRNVKGVYEYRKL